MSQLPEEITTNGFFPLIVAQLVRWMAAGPNPWGVSDTKLTLALQTILNAIDPQCSVMIVVGDATLRVVSSISWLSIYHMIY